MELTVDNISLSGCRSVFQVHTKSKTLMFQIPLNSKSSFYWKAICYQFLTSHNLPYILFWNRCKQFFVITYEFCEVKYQRVFTEFNKSFK